MPRPTVPNEDSDVRLAFMRELAETAKALDPTRTVGAAVIHRQKFCIEDRLIDHIDVIGINEYFGSYEPGFPSSTVCLAEAAVSPAKTSACA